MTSFALQNFMRSHSTIECIEQKCFKPGHSSIPEFDNIHSHIEKVVNVSEMVIGNLVQGKVVHGIFVHRKFVCDTGNDVIETTYRNSHSVLALESVTIFGQSIIRHVRVILRVSEDNV